MHQDEQRVLARSNERHRQQVEREIEVASAEKHGGQYQRPFGDDMKGTSERGQSRQFAQLLFGQLDRNVAVEIVRRARLCIPISRLDRYSFDFSSFE